MEDECHNVANLHVIMAAITNCRFFAVLLPAGAQKYGLVEGIEVDGQDLVHAMNEPALGAKIDFALIERKKLVPGGLVRGGGATVAVGRATWGRVSKSGCASTTSWSSMA